MGLDRESVGVRMNLLKYLEAEADKLHEENFSSSDEFRTVNNSFVEGFNYALAIVQGHEIKLNENQQVVLDYLTSENRLTKEAPLLSINNFSEKHFGAELPEKVETAYRELKAEEDYEILAAFAEWGKKEVAE